MHWALQAIKRGTARAPGGLVLTMALGIAFLLTQIREYSRVGFAPERRRLRDDLLRPDGPPRRARVRRALRCSLIATIRAFRGHYSPEAHHGRRDAGDLLALRRRNVDRRLHHDLHPLAETDFASLRRSRREESAPQRGRRISLRSDRPRVLRRQSWIASAARRALVGARRLRGADARWRSAR